MFPRSFRLGRGPVPFAVGHSGFNDQYILGDKLARGGFGTTYLAVERNTDRPGAPLATDERAPAVWGRIFG